VKETGMKIISLSEKLQNTKGMLDS